MFTCVVSYSISTSNHNIVRGGQNKPSVVSYSISTSNHNTGVKICYKVFVVSYSISTSNHNLHDQTPSTTTVVSYSISTSNHNPRTLIQTPLSVVSYSISTSNHNTRRLLLLMSPLYLIPFLHQTTTAVRTTCRVKGCILFHFYIKPQPMAHKTLFSSTLSPKSHSHFQRNAVA